jgi:hypothetical protein
VRFFSAAALVQLGDAGEPIRHESASGTRVDGFSIPLKLVVAQGGARPPVRAARIALDHADWLKKLVYLLPPHVLAGYRVCLTEESIFLFNEGEAEFVPLGTLFYQVALGVMVPVGFELVPRVHPEVLVQHLESGRDKLYFFCTDSPIPIQLPLPAFEPLTRQVLAHLQVRPLAPVARERPTTREAQLVNDPVGLFPLWGFSAKADPESEGG